MATAKGMKEIAWDARQAGYVLANTSYEERSAAVLKMAREIDSGRKSILRANLKDLKAASGKHLKRAFLDRLSLNDTRIEAMVESLKTISHLDDPLGNIQNVTERPNGLVIAKMRVPIGVIGIIYEARPNVTSDCAGLCIMSGNSVILKGGSDAIHTNMAIFKCIMKAVSKTRIPREAISLIIRSSRSEISRLLKLNEYIDLIIPRGGEGLIKKVTRESRIPVIKHYKGVCHVYVDSDADINMAHSIAINAKVQRPGVCNAMESLLVHRHIASRYLPVLGYEFRKLGVEIRGCKETKVLLGWAERAKESDWSREYNDLVLSVKVVADVDEAIRHINRYGTRHSDSIVTESLAHALKFLREVDSACVYLNASTRFTDGYEFGMGAEIGISTDKLHARGPMALKELTTYKYVVFGNGQIRK